MMPSDLAASMMRFFSSPGAGRKLQRKSGPPTLLVGSSSDAPEDIDAPLRYFPGKALHADFWRDGVRPPGFKYPSGREARVVVPILGMCGVGRTCVSNYLQDGYWGGQEQPNGEARPRAQRYYCDNVIYKITTVKIPPRSELNGLLKQFEKDTLSMPIVIAYSVTWKESYTVACRLFDDLRGAVTRAKLPVPVMLMGLRKDSDSHRQVTRAEAEAFAKRRSIMFAETSAMTGRGVRGAFGMLVEAIRQHGETMSRGIEGSSLVERQRLDDLKQEIFRLGIECFEATKDRRCPAYQSRWDPGVQAPVLRRGQTLQQRIPRPPPPQTEASNVQMLRTQLSLPQMPTMQVPATQVPPTRLLELQMAGEDLSQGRKTRRHAQILASSPQSPTQQTAMPPISLAEEQQVELPFSPTLEPPMPKWQIQQQREAQMQMSRTQTPHSQIPRPHVSQPRTPRAYASPPQIPPPPQTPHSESSGLQVTGPQTPRSQRMESQIPVPPLPQRLRPSMEQQRPSNNYDAGIAF